MPVEKPITDTVPPKRQAAKRHYGVHPYFTRRAWNVVQEYIRHFTQVDSVVLDPFGQSSDFVKGGLVPRRFRCVG